MKAVWLPYEDDDISVEWYLTDNRALGVNSMSDVWHLKRLAPDRPLGFEPPPRDPGPARQRRV